MQFNFMLPMDVTSPIMWGSLFGLCAGIAGVLGVRFANKLPWFKEASKV